MAVYSGTSGIEQLKAKIRLKSKKLVGESAEKIAIALVDDSPLGAEYYHSLEGNVENDVGDFKNSWTVGNGSPDPTSRHADPTGSSAIANAIAQGKAYNLQSKVYVTNNVEHAGMVEHGWDANPVYGWEAKDGYHTVRENIGTANLILTAVAAKVSLL